MKDTETWFYGSIY